MPRPKIDEEALWNGWEFEEKTVEKSSYDFFLSRYDQFGALARVGFRTKAAALGFAMANPAPNNVTEAGKYVKGLPR